jgi:Iap family predicted aminopeptidase
MLVRNRRAKLRNRPVHSRAVNLVQTIGVELGVRQAGTPASGRSADAVAAAFRELGLEPEFREFELLGYEAEEPVLEIEGERWDAGPCMYANPTDGAVEGRVRRLGSHSVGGFFPDADVFAIEGEDGRELARVLMSPFGGAAIPFLTGVRQIAVGPTVFISGADAARLRDREGAKARIRVGGRFVPGRTERNVVAELRGESEEAIVVSAHHDSVWRGPGVIDNATGLEGIRRLAERFVGGTLPRSLLFVAFAAEEIGCVGSRQFIFEAEISGEIERIKACVNLDCIAHGERFELNVSPPALRERVGAIAADLGLRERYDVHLAPASPGVDAYAFDEKGIPSASFSHFPYDEYHLPNERLELVDDARMADSVEVAARVIEGLLEEPVPPSE